MREDERSADELLVALVKAQLEDGASFEEVAKLLGPGGMLRLVRGSNEAAERARRDSDEAEQQRKADGDA